MSSGEQPGRPEQEEARPAGDPGTPVPVAPDRPVVAGEEKSSQELMAEVAELSDERRQQVDELREDVSETLGELVGRLDVPNRARRRRDEVAVAVRARSRAVAVAVAQREAVLGMAGAALLVVLVAFARSRSSRRRAG